MVKHYKVVCISLYVEELVALDAKVEALKAAGYRKANRSTVLALAATHIDDDALVALLPKSRAVSEKKPRMPKPEPVTRVCKRCGIEGHYARSCRGREREEQRQ